MMNEYGGWICPDCGEMNNLPTGEICDCEQDEEELEYMPIEMTIGRYEWLAPWEDVYEPEHIRPGGVTRDESDDEWADEHERDDGEGWEDES